MTDPTTPLRTAAEALRSVNDHISKIEAELEMVNNRRIELERVELPELFAEAGITSITLDDGSVLKLSVMAEGSLPKDPAKRVRAIEWLVANGYEDLVENKVTASFSRGERAQAQAEYNRLQALGSAKVALDEGIHFKVLGARMKDRVLEGLPTPLEDLGISVFNRARFTVTRGRI